ncbi:hypothetical protein brsh051_24210 [Brooklawnia propionicigenes]|uniref:GGDEF domain-containing protein n=1 Tax=Brooklawnia propionicigenes TaxID=3041175 RepID=A0AAN0KD62_9ACTN|nr:GGDEF domain-containing protein [Brooklawnia sp. SH051]BEH03140.1 hypothetical protein brsh051_24210 [Brooklawnia sp. SH051]
MTDGSEDDAWRRLAGLAETLHSPATLRDDDLARAEEQMRATIDSLSPHVGSVAGCVAALIHEVRAQRSELEELRQRLVSEARLDPLTGVQNRLRGRELLTEWQLAGQQFTVCFVDLDGLKLVNDHLGHHEGDRYLRCVAENLNALTEANAVCRVGGDEFLVLFLNAAEDDCRDLMAGVQTRLAEASPSTGPQFSISYGIAGGISTSPRGEDLLRLADERMYQHKGAQHSLRSPDPATTS